MFEIKNFFYIPLFSYKYISKTSIFFSVVLVRTHQKPTPNPPESEKPNPAWCGFSNPKPTPTHILVGMVWIGVGFGFENPHQAGSGFSGSGGFVVGFTVGF